MSSRELNTSKFSLVLRTRENSDVFNTLHEIYLVFTSKKVNILYVFVPDLCLLTYFVMLTFAFLYYKKNGFII